MKKLMSLASALGLVILALVFQSEAVSANPTEANVKVYLDEEGKPYTGTLVQNYSNGRTKCELNIVNGLIQGEVKFYYETGEMHEVGVYKDGMRQGTWMEYSKEGKVKGVAFFKDDKKHGTWKLYADNGVMTYEMHYDLDKRVGTWKQFNDQGVLIAERAY